MSTGRPTVIDEYLAKVPSDTARATLSRLREIIREEVPDAEEVISYGIPTFKLHGTIASFAAFKNHCSFFPGPIVEGFAEELKGYKTSKGTIQFPHDQLLPEGLVRKVIAAKVSRIRRAQQRG